MNRLHCFLLVVISLSVLPVTADELVSRRDLTYGEAGNRRQMLDVYHAPVDPTAKPRPIVFWVHGGGWTAGDKSGVGRKPQVFVDKGYVFVAANYRFIPQVNIKDIAADLAKAIRYVHDHAGEYGGDGRSIVVMGHSAGAHLAALLCTDDRYLKAEKLPLSIVRGCVPLDVSFYDVPKRIADGGDTKPEVIRKIFTADEAFQRECSPATYVAKGREIPPFLLLHVAERADTKAQAHAFAAKLREAGVAADIVAPTGKTHGSIGSELAVVDDATTQAVFAFLDKVRRVPR